MHAVLEGAEARRKYADLPPKKRVWGFREPRRFRIRKTASQVVETRLEIRLTATIFASGLSVYNNADQLLTENGTTYTYDLNGNLKTKTDASGTTTYTWDYEDRLVKVAGPSGTVTYEYDVDGNRVSSTTAAGTTRYLVDTNRALPQVLAEYTPDGGVLASYVYADDLISMTRGNQTRWYHFDGLGSTRLLTDETGAVTDTYSYDAFGNLIARTGTTQNDFLFTGQQRDASAGWYYLRARWLDPGAGRFASVDPIPGATLSPISLHRYLYALDNPISYSDPSGEFASLSEIAVTTSVIGIMATIAMPGFALAGVAGKSKWMRYVGTQIIMYQGTEGVLAASLAVGFYRATSGLPGYQDTGYQNMKDAGPIPKGRYRVNLVPDPNRIAKADSRTGELLSSPQGGIERIPERFVARNGTEYTYGANGAPGGWGNIRAALWPDSGTATFGRNAFYLHDSKKGYSHGCIETESALFNVLIELRKSSKNVLVMVDYEGTSTYGGTRR